MTVTQAAIAAGVQAVLAQAGIEKRLTPTEEVVWPIVWVALEAAAPHLAAAERERCADLLETAWGIIANAGWDDCAKTPGWQEAAERWRDGYHAFSTDRLREQP